ncbi:MAG: CehA/McbA family metallohydrolase domain-containing protein [Candidatus Dormibacteria bacterium]
MSESPPPPNEVARPGASDLGPVVFVIALVMFAVALGVVIVRNRGDDRPLVGAVPRHHVLISPYIATPFARGGLHAQTLRADGHSTPRDVAHGYLDAGDRWFSIEDVNTPSPASISLIQGILPVPGDLATYPFATLLAIGVDHHEAAVNLQGAIDWIHRDAGVAVLADPLAAPALTPEDIEGTRGLDALEVYDARLARDQPTAADATALWDRLLSDGVMVYGLAGDGTLDASGPGSTLGRTYVSVQAARVQAPLIDDAIRRGAFISGTGVTVLGVDASGDRVTIVTTDAVETSFYGAGGRLLSTVSGPRAVYQVKWNEAYVRAVARDAAGHQAWIQPIRVVP